MSNLQQMSSYQFSSIYNRPNSIIDSSKPINIDFPSPQQQSMQLNDIMMDDQSYIYHQQSSQAQIPAEQQQKDQLKKSKATYILYQCLKMQTQAINVIDLKIEFFIEAQNLNMKTKNAKRRFYDIIKTLKQIGVIKVENKKIALYTQNTKMTEMQELKNQILKKEYVIEQQKARLDQLRDYKEIMGRMVKRNRNDPSDPSRKKIPYPFSLIVRQNPAKEAILLKPTRAARYFLRIPSEGQQNEHKGYYQAIYHLMANQHPIKTAQE